MKVLFIGGTGEISAACSWRAAELGLDLHLLTRGRGVKRPVPEGAELLRADIRDPAAARAAIGSRDFDVVAFTPQQVQADIDLFRRRAGQDVFISSASAYQTPPSRLPIVESTPLRNPVWPYSQAKIACEDLLTRAYRDEAFPVTILAQRRLRQGPRRAARTSGGDRRQLPHHLRRGAHLERDPRAPRCRRRRRAADRPCPLRDDPERR
jgi:nucleoside-diphosphate-sugar epimerase